MGAKRKNGYVYGNENHGRSSERKVAKRLGARTVRGSGAGYEKGDAVLRRGGDINFRIESKATIHQSMSVKKEWLDKITNEALSTGCDPALSVTFVDEHGEPRGSGSKWVMVPEHVFRELTTKGD